MAKGVGSGDALDVSVAADSVATTMMTTPHPWRDLLEKWPGTRIFWRDLGVGTRGKTDGKDIWIHDRLLQVERRCTAA